MTKRLPASWIAALFGIAFAASFALAVTHTVPFSARTFLYDFRASLCAGRALDQGADPYRTEPLRTCEHEVAPFRADLANLTAPAPIPGYELAVFAMLARLPYRLAGAFWLFVSLAAFVVTGYALQRLSLLPGRVVWSLIVLPACLSIFLGQLALVSLAALVLAGLALQQGRFALAALAASVAAIEPHVALPSLVALALFVPRTRVTLALCAVFGAAISLFALGLHGNFEFVRSVLPAQTASELANEEQYSLAYALHQIGMSDVAALAWSNLSFAVAIVFGIACTRTLVARGAPVSLYALVPTAFAVMGGPYVHIHHIAFAIPAAAVLFGRKLLNSPALAFSLVAFAVPWGAFAALLPLLPVAAVAVFVLAQELRGARPSLAAVYAVVSASFLLFLSLALKARPSAHDALLSFTDGRGLPELAWRAYIDAAYHSNVGVFALSKIPTVAALVVLAVSIGLAAARSNHLEVWPGRRVRVT